jgi:hypothetical protein
MNSAALIKQELHDDLRKDTHKNAKSDEKRIEFNGGIFEHLL